MGCKYQDHAQQNVAIEEKLNDSKIANYVIVCGLFYWKRIY